MAIALACVPVAARAGQKQATSPAIPLGQQEKAQREIVKAHPDDAAAHLRLSQIYIDEGRWLGAVDEARAAKRISPQSDEADALLATALFLDGDEDALLTQIKPGNRAPEAESVIRMRLGLAHFDIGESSAAEPLLRDAVKLDPKSWRARIAYARILILQRRLPEARDQVEAAQALAPTEVGMIRIRAELKSAEGDLEGAVADYTEVIELHPTSLPALAGRANVLIRLGKLADAERDVNTAYRLVHNSQILFLQALISARQGKLPLAGQILQKASRAFRHFPIGYYLDGVVTYLNGQPDTAYDSLARFHASNPTVQGCTLLMAEMDIQSTDLASAIHLLEPLVAANPTDAEAVTKLARAYLVNGEIDSALKLYQQVVAAPPPAKPLPDADPFALIMMYGDATGDLVPIEKIAMRKTPDAVEPAMALRRGDIAAAAVLAEAAAKRNPDDPTIQTLLGSVRLAQKRFADASEIFTQVAKKHPDYTPAAFGLVEVLVSAGRLDAAKDQLSKLAHSAANE